MAQGYKTGGRKAGTPNKDNPLKGFLRTHSTAYFEPSIHVDASLADTLGIDLPRLCLALGCKKGDTVSRFDLDQGVLEPHERVEAEIKILNYCLPKLTTSNIDLAVNDPQTLSLEERLAALARMNEE